MSEEKRAFSRVPVRLKGFARKMRSIDSSPVYIGEAVAKSFDPDAIFRNSKLPEEVTLFLAELNRKLDSVLGMLSQTNLRSDFPIDIEIVELSGAGLKFRTAEALPAETPLEVVFILSQVPLKMASSKGRIIGDREAPDLYRFEFVDTRGSDNEAIVQFVFRQQREHIRNSKL